MRKNKFLILLISLLCCLVFVFSACGKNPDGTDKTDGNCYSTNTRVKVTMNDTVVYALINDTVTGKAFLELLPFHVTGYRADIDICCSVSEQLPNDPSEDEEWNIGEIGWFRGWFTILCDNEEQFRGQVRTIIGKFEDEYISVVTSLSGSIDITIELPSDNESEEITEMFITINGNKLKVTLTQNSTVDALVELLKKGDITYTANDYGGFEKVGGLGHTLPTNHVQTVTEPGDIVLYQTNQIVMFYGSNSWAYTRIGKINYSSQSELENFLGAGQGSVQVTISLK